MTADFTTTSDFVEGSGKSYPAGTNVCIVNVGTVQTPSYKYDILAGTYFAVSTDHAALKALRDGGNLVPGTWYRITNYECISMQPNTKCAGHAFDIIVRADDASHLNENAYAAHHEGDTYFQNCKLEAWELKYSIDNDTSRFAWADDTNGKGVVYWMKDEWDNECPYDFKNIMFKRLMVRNSSHDSFNFNSSDNIRGYYYGVKDFEDSCNLDGDFTEKNLCYTFTLKDLATGEYFDYTVEAHRGLYNDEGTEMTCYGNRIEPVIDEYTFGKAAFLNDIVFFSAYSDLSDISYADDYSYCDNNHIGGCSFVTFADSQRNVLKSGSHMNTFGMYCYDNILGFDCSYNIFENGCQKITLGSECMENEFGNDCNEISFGDRCIGNSLSADCSGINLMGHNSQIAFYDQCLNSAIFPGASYLVIKGDGNDGAVSNIQVLSDVKGADGAIVSLSFSSGKGYTQVAGKNSSNSLRIFVPADMQ